MLLLLLLILLPTGTLWSIGTMHRFGGWALLMRSQGSRLPCVDKIQGGVQAFTAAVKCLMNNTIAVLGAMALITGTALAGPKQIIKQRAKDLRDQNNLQQGVGQIQPTPTPSAPAAPAPPPVSVSLTHFQSTLAGIHTDSEVSAAQKEKLTQDLLAAASGAKPSQAAAAKLAEDLTAAFVQKPLPESGRAKLIRELDAVLNPGKYPQAKLEGIFADVQASFRANGLSQSKAAAIADDVKAISAEVQKGSTR